MAKQKQRRIKKRVNLLNEWEYHVEEKAWFFWHLLDNGIFCTESKVRFMDQCHKSHLQRLRASRKPHKLPTIPMVVTQADTTAVVQMVVRI